MLKLESKITDLPLESIPFLTLVAADIPPSHLSILPDANFFFSHYQSSMPIQIREADPSCEWDEIFAREWVSWTNPPQSIWSLTFPIIGTGPTAEAEAIKIGAARQQGMLADPLCRWIKAVDDESGKIVGGALWKFYPTNPYRTPMAKLVVPSRGAVRPEQFMVRAEQHVGPQVHARCARSSVDTIPCDC